MEVRSREGETAGVRTEGTGSGGHTTPHGERKRQHGARGTEASAGRRRPVATMLDCEGGGRKGIIGDVE